MPNFVRTLPAPKRDFNNDAPVAWFASQSVVTVPTGWAAVNDFSRLVGAPARRHRPQPEFNQDGPLAWGAAQASFWPAINAFVRAGSLLPRRRLGPENAPFNDGAWISSAVPPVVLVTVASVPGDNLIQIVGWPRPEFNNDAPMAWFASQPTGPPAGWVAVDAFSRLAGAPARQPRLEVRFDDGAWIFSAIPPAFNPAFWPAIEFFLRSTGLGRVGRLALPPDFLPWPPNAPATPPPPTAGHRQFPSWMRRWFLMDLRN